MCAQMLFHRLILLLSASLCESAAAARAIPAGADADAPVHTASLEKSTADAPNWAHGWDTPASAWWGYGAFGGWVSSDADIEFVAQTYKIVVLSLNNADTTMHMSVAEATMNVSARLKAVNPALKVLQYFNMEMFAGYSKTDPEYAMFLQHPEWWLRDDDGNPVISQFGPGYDFSNEAAVQH